MLSIKFEASISKLIENLNICVIGTACMVIYVVATNHQQPDSVLVFAK